VTVLLERYGVAQANSVVDDGDGKQHALAVVTAVRLLLQRQ
jgi:hypothetical protein